MPLIGNVLWSSVIIAATIKIIIKAASAPTRNKLWLIPPPISTPSLRSPNIAGHPDPQGVLTHLIGKLSAGQVQAGRRLLS